MQKSKLIFLTAVAFFTTCCLFAPQNTGNGQGNITPKSSVEEAKDKLAEQKQIQDDNIKDLSEGLDRIGELNSATELSDNTVKKRKRSKNPDVPPHLTSVSVSDSCDSLLVSGELLTKPTVKNKNVFSGIWNWITGIL